MSHIDWNFAPTWADKHGFASYGGHPVWLNNDQYCYVDGSQSGRVFSFCAHEGWQLSEIQNISFRAIQKAWSGEGLPPVGTVCELKKSTKFTEGTRLEEFPAGTRMLVGGHANFGGHDVVAVAVEGRNFCGTIIPEMLQPIRTPEQIAKEARQTAIEGLGNYLMQNSSVPTPYLWEVAQKIYDAGYRKFEITDDSDPV